MPSDELEIYPIEHRGKVYNIITSYDLSFREVRGMLDWLDEREAFRIGPEEEFLGPGKLFTCRVEGILLEVDVQGYEVLVLRRSGPE
ncbi:MAG: hypothetical protein Kow00128_02710 [Deltaproteobacteria bacterium]